MPSPPRCDRAGEAPARRAAGARWVHFHVQHLLRNTYYRERCRAHGRAPSGVAIRRDIYVAESVADTQATMAAVMAAGYRGFDPTVLIAMTVDDVAARFRELGAMGYTDVIVRHLMNDQPKVLGSLARLAEVRKAVQDV